jgi:hypothetical protein
MPHAHLSTPFKFIIHCRPIIRRYIIWATRSRHEVHRILLFTTVTRRNDGTVTVAKQRNSYGHKFRSALHVFHYVSFKDATGSLEYLAQNDMTNEY